MYCQKCNANNASIHLTQIINGEKTELHLCENCAKSEGYGIEEYPFSLNNFLAGLFDFPGFEIKEPHIAPPKSLKCNNCGMDFEEFKRIGKFGCSECYIIFGDKLTSIFKRLHGNTYHSGKVPKRTGVNIKYKKEVEKLQLQLNKSIINEEYEKAAEFRDLIKDIEKKYSV